MLNTYSFTMLIPRELTPNWSLKNKQLDIYVRYENYKGGTGYTIKNIVFNNPSSLIYLHNGNFLVNEIMKAIENNIHSRQMETINSDNWIELGDNEKWDNLKNSQNY